MDFNGLLVVFEGFGWCLLCLFDVLYRPGSCFGFFK